MSILLIRNLRLRELKQLASFISHTKNDKARAVNIVSYIRFLIIQP